MISLFTFVTKNQQTAGFEKKRPANQDKPLDGHYISVSWTGTKLGPNMYFVNKQLTDKRKNWDPLDFSSKFQFVWDKRTFSEILSKIEREAFKKIEKEYQLFVYKKFPIDNFFCFWSDFDETLWDCSTHEQFFDTVNELY